MYEIYCKLRDSRGVKDADVVRETGITKSTFSDWKNGRSKPKNDKLQKIADYFGVSVDYLMTGEENLSEKKNPFSDLKGIYLSYAKEAQDNGIDPDDIKLALETIKRLRGDKQ
ncbi:helix-turn-helix domain-containing protein [Hungatella hathewayi]|uniref:helix-turn-helix domain-containing protein n=1 Tax=Hungatella hathewayi TaxID=154046 RepID=UPI0035661660